VALYPDVAPFADNRFYCCHLLQCGVIHDGTGKAIATPVDTMTRERDERMWNLAYRLAGSGDYESGIGRRDILCSGGSAVFSSLSACRCSVEAEGENKHEPVAGD
jgi:hypothetical protein